MMLLYHLMASGWTMESERQGILESFVIIRLVKE